MAETGASYAVAEHFDRLNADIAAAAGARSRWNRLTGGAAALCLGSLLMDEVSPAAGWTGLAGLAFVLVLLFGILGQSAAAKAARLGQEREEARLPVLNPGDAPEATALEALAAGLPLRRSLTLARGRLFSATLGAVVLGGLGLTALAYGVLLALDWRHARFADGVALAEAGGVLSEGLAAGGIGAVLLGWALSRQADAAVARRESERLEVEVELLGYGGGEAGARARKLFLLNEQSLRKYYEANRFNARLALAVAVACIAAGLGITLWTISLVLDAAGDPTRSEALVAGVGAANAVMINVVAAIVLRVHASVSSNVNAFHERLVRTHEAFLAGVMATEIGADDARDAAYGAVAARLGGAAGARAGGEADTRG